MRTSFFFVRTILSWNRQLAPISKSVSHSRNFHHKNPSSATGLTLKSLDLLKVLRNRYDFNSPSSMSLALLISALSRNRSLELTVIKVDQLSDDFVISLLDWRTIAKFLASTSNDIVAVLEFMALLRKRENIQISAADIYDCTIKLGLPIFLHSSAIQNISNSAFSSSNSSSNSHIEKGRNRRTNSHIIGLLLKAIGPSTMEIVPTSDGESILDAPVRINDDANLRSHILMRIANEIAKSNLIAALKFIQVIQREVERVPLPLLHALFASHAGIPSLLDWNDPAASSMGRDAVMTELFAVLKGHDVQSFPDYSFFSPHLRSLDVSMLADCPDSARQYFLEPILKLFLEEILESIIAANANAIGRFRSGLMDRNQLLHSLDKVTSLNVVVGSCRNADTAAFSQLIESFMKSTYNVKILDAFIVDTLSKIFTINPNELHLFEDYYNFLMKKVVAMRGTDDYKSLMRFLPFHRSTTIILTVDSNAVRAAAMARIASASSEQAIAPPLPGAAAAAAAAVAGITTAAKVDDLLPDVDPSNLFSAVADTTGPTTSSAGSKKANGTSDDHDTSSSGCSSQTRSGISPLSDIRVSRKAFGELVIKRQRMDDRHRLQSWISAFEISQKKGTYLIGGR